MLLNYVSYGLGLLSRIPLFSPLNRWVITIFARLAGADISEASQPLDSYRSVNSFFTRALKTGLRPIGAQPVSPADGTLSARGRIEEGTLHQIKGKTYSLDKLVGDPDMSARYQDGTFFTVYLSPKDYHRVHAPCDGTIQSIVHIPGSLWPVNSLGLNRISDLFAKNERVLLHCSSPQGDFAIILVGALNVGNMTLESSPLVTNQPKNPSSITIHAPSPEKASFVAGDLIGRFNLGSTVVLLFDKKWNFQIPEDSGLIPIRMGRSLLGL